MSKKTFDQVHRPTRLECRAYAFREFAHLYFPNIMPEHASRRLRRFIVQDAQLLQQLEARGWRRNMRSLMPAHVSYLIQELGTPEEFYEIMTGD